MITKAPGAVAYGQTLTVTSPNASSITRITFIRLSAVTHAFNQSQRMNVLSFTPGTVVNTLSVRAPLNANLAPPGHYMLFIVNGNGVPSLAKIVRLR